MLHNYYRRDSGKRGGGKEGVEGGTQGKEREGRKGTQGREREGRKGKRDSRMREGGKEKGGGTQG